MQKTLRFTKKPLDLSNDKDFGVTIVAVDNLRFFMRNFKNMIGHDDSLSYIAELWAKHISGEFMFKIADCFNDGWGGQTDITFVDNELTKEIIDKVSQFKWKLGKSKFELTMDFIADILACTCDCYNLRETYK